jgi:ABC-type transport system involved in multi-copper enzyme maturation permease subunit
VSATVNVIRAELFKALRKRRTYILAALQWGLLPILVLIAGRVVQVNVSGSFVDEGELVDSLIQSIASPFGIARLSLMGPSYVSPTFYIIVIALFAALLIGEEKRQNMWKTALVAQPNRLAVLGGKFVVAMLLYAVFLLGAYLSSILFGIVGMTFLPTSFAGEWGSLFGLYALQWLHGGAAFLFAFLMIFLARNIALGIVMVFFLPALIEGLYTVYRTAIGFQPLNRLNAIFQALRLRQTLEELPRYFFTYNQYAPARNPTLELVTALGGDATGSDFGPFSSFLGAGITLSHATLVMAGYAVIFGALLTWLFLRRDVQ